MERLDIERELSNLTTLSKTGAPISRNLAERSIRRICRELLAYKVPPHITWDEVNLSKKLESVRHVNIGCGGKNIPDFLNIDIAEPCDLLWDVRTGLPLADNSVELIFSEHFLEHIDYDYSARILLNDCFRTLNPNGRVIFGVPDAEVAIRAYAEADSSAINLLLKSLYSKRDLSLYKSSIDIVNLFIHDEYSSLRYNSHWWGYDFRSLSSLLSGAGFSNAERIEILPDNISSTSRPATLYISAKKLIGHNEQVI